MRIISKNALSLIIVPPSGRNSGLQEIQTFFGRCDVYYYMYISLVSFWVCSGSEKCNHLGQKSNHSQVKTCSGSNCNQWSQSSQITSTLFTQLPHTGLWYFKCPMFCSVCSSFGPGTASVSVSAASAAAHGKGSPPCILPSAPLPDAAGISSGLSCCWCTPWTRSGHWSQSGWRCYRRPPLAIFVYRLWVHPHHLVRDVHATLGIVIVHHRLWFCHCPSKGAHTCVHSAQDADILSRLSLVHGQSRITTLQHLCVEQLHLLHGGGELPFLFAHGANQAI